MESLLEGTSTFQAKPLVRSCHKAIRSSVGGVSGYLKMMFVCLFVCLFKKIQVIKVRSYPDSCSIPPTPPPRRRRR